MARPVTSLEGFIRKAMKLQAEHRFQTLLFRGHSKKTYNLSPAVFRSNNLSNSEHLMFRQLLAEHPSEFEGDQSNFDRLVRAQHYGLPTRLLDVSDNPLVALFFACNSSPSIDGQVIVITPEISKQKYYDSASVSVMSALSLLTFSEKRDIAMGVLDTWHKSPSGVDVWDQLPDELISDFNDTPGVKTLLQVIRSERPNFESRIHPTDLLRVISVVPRKAHDRIKAQGGGFLLYGLTEVSNELNTPNIAVEKFSIGASSKSKIASELRRVRISEETLFPEIERTAQQIMRRYS